MKHFKKTISLILAVCMLASLAISASAANTVELLHSVHAQDFWMKFPKDKLRLKVIIGQNSMLFLLPMRFIII